MIVVDLFSGTGAASKAFKDRGHKVITVDIDPKLKPDIVADIRHFPLRNLKPDFVWASPPCTEFSLARRVPGDIEGGLQLVAAACDALASLDPKYWLIENVLGAERYLGRPTKRVKSWSCWGRFPPFDAKTPWKYQMASSRKMPRPGGGWMYSAKNAHARARVPYALSLALCCALERDLA